MHKTFFKKLLIALIVALPTLSAAADVVPVGEPKATAPAQTTVSTPQVITKESKPAEAVAVRHSVKIGYVDIARIGTESDRGKALKALLTAKKDQLQGKIEEKKKQIEKLKTSIEAKIATMTPQQREAKSKEFQKKLEEFQKFAEKTEEEFFTLQEKETKSVYEEIEKSAVNHGKANGFSVIVVKKELLYVGSAVDAQDVTEALIKVLNEAGQKK
jgi:outer membrane protein